MNIANINQYLCSFLDARVFFFHHKKELLLVLFSVGFLGEHLGGRSCLGFAATMVGVGLYKLVPKRSPQGDVHVSQVLCYQAHHILVPHGVHVLRVDVRMYADF